MEDYQGGPSSSLGESAMDRRLLAIQEQNLRAKNLAILGIGLACVGLFVTVSRGLTALGRTNAGNDVEYGTIKAKRVWVDELRITSNNGSEAIVWVNNEGQPTLSFFDGAGKNKMNLGLNINNDPFMLLFDGHGNRRTGIYAGSQDRQGAGHITFYGLEKQPRLQLGLAPGDTPVISLQDKDGRGRVSMHMSADGKAEVQVRSPDLMRGIRMISTPDAKPSVTFFDKDRLYEVPSGP